MFAIGDPVFLRMVCYGFGYQRWVLVLKSQFMRFVVNVSGIFLGEHTPELIRDSDAM